MTPFYHTLLAEVCLMGGDLVEAKAAVDRSLQISLETGECWSAPMAQQLAVKIERAAGRLELAAAIERMRTLSREASGKGEWLWVVTAEKWILAAAAEAGVAADSQPMRDVLERFPRTDPYPLLREAKYLLNSWQGR
jgi:hypothetical protein